MRAGIVSTWFDRGAGNVSKQLMQSLVAAGASVNVYARGERYARGDANWDASNVHWGKRLHWTGSGKIDKADFRDWLDATSPDVIIFNEQRWWQPVLWAKEMGIKCAAFIDYYTEASVPLFEAYDVLICNTRRHFSAFAWHPGARYLPWGTDVSVFTPQVPGDRRFTFFHSAGWDGYRKGLDLLVTAFGLIRDSIDADLVIHTQKDIEHLIELDDRIRIIQATVPAPGLYHLGDVYVYPSRLDGVGLTICEALACGLPVITTDEPPMSEFVSHGINGMLVPVKARFRRADQYYWRVAEACPLALSKLMRNAYELRGRRLDDMRRNARESALEKWDWHKNASGLFGALSTAPRVELTSDLRRRVDRLDHQGLKGKADYLLRFAATRSIGSSLVAAYRRLRQPHLYRSQ